MSAAALPHDAFAPRAPAGMRSGLALAVVAHVLLVLALAWSVSWRSSEPEGVVAELWSALPQTAAPRMAAPQPTPTPPTPQVVAPRPTPPPTPPIVAPRPVPAPRPEPLATPREDAQIAIDRALREKQRRSDAERVEARRQADKADKADKAEKLEKARRDQAVRAQAELQRQRLAEEQRAEQKKAADKARLDEARQESIREANLRKLRSQAGSGDDAQSTGTAARTSGPSAGYAGRIKARIKPNIVLTGSVAGNPLATVEVRLAPDGTIVGRKLVRSSGSPVWDETVMRAIEKTDVLPRDLDGRVPSSMVIEFKPQE